MTYEQLAERAATVGITIQPTPIGMSEAYRNNRSLCTVGDGQDGRWLFLRGVSAALDAVEAMQAERKPAGELPWLGEPTKISKGGAA